jgi:hypothetical protein
MRVDHGGCSGTASASNYPSVQSIVEACTDAECHSTLPCMNGTVVTEAPAQEEDKEEEKEEEEKPPPPGLPPKGARLQCDAANPHGVRCCDECQVFDSTISCAEADAVRESSADFPYGKAWCPHEQCCRPARDGAPRHRP